MNRDARARDKLRRARHDDPVAFDIAQHRTWAWQGVKRVARLGITGQIGAQQAPGYAVGLRALSFFLARTDPEGDRVDAHRVIAVQINITPERTNAQPGLRAGRLEIPLAGDRSNGDHA